MSTTAAQALRNANELAGLRPNSSPGRVLTAEERAALMGDRPDLQRPEPVSPDVRRRRTLNYARRGPAAVAKP